MAATKVPTQLNIQCRGIILEQVENFKYLGAIIDQTGEGSHESRLDLEQQDWPYGL